MPPNFVRSLAAFALGALLPSAPAASPPPVPNIVFILTDDQGYGDLSAHGNPVLSTPHLDRLRCESARFEDFLVSPTCSPTRAALMTGRHAFRNGVTHTIFERERLALDAVTLPGHLKTGGYATGIFGKWHLGDEPDYRPERRGFDEVFIHGGGGIGQSYPGSCGDAPGNTYFDPLILHNGTFVATRGFCTDVFFERALTWMDERRRAGDPFFAYIATNAPHAPYTARSDDAALYLDRAPTEAVANFFGMIHNIDENVGRLLNRLAEWGIERNTLVILMTDNGTSAGARVYNAGMRGNKGSPWRGGTRSISLWRWPGRIPPADIAATAAHIDVLPTLADLTGTPLDDRLRRQVEGRSFWPLLLRPEFPWPERIMVTHRGRWARFSDPDDAKYAGVAVRRGPWKLVSLEGGAAPEWELYRLDDDPAESIDVAGRFPRIVAELASEYDRWWTSVRPSLVNEHAVGPRINSFAELYWRQFGGGPSEDQLRRMDPGQSELPRGRP